MEGEDPSVVPPALGAQRGWPDVDSFVVDIFQRVTSGARLFPPNETMFDESDPRVEVPVDGGSIPFNELRANMYRIWAEADASERQDATYLRTAFMRASGYRVRFAGSAALGENSLFEFDLGRLRTRGGVFGNRDGRTGVRTGHFGARQPKGQVAEIQAELSKNRAKYEQMLRGDETMCLQDKRFGKQWSLVPPGETIDILLRTSCVFLGIWLRYSENPFVAELRKILGEDANRKAEKVGYKAPRAVTDAKTKLLFMMTEIVAKDRNISNPMDLWREGMSDAVIDTEIWSICKEFKINLMVVQNGVFARYKEMAAAEDHNGTGLIGLYAKPDMWRCNKKHLRVMIFFNGRPGEGFERRNGGSMLMVCSYLGDRDAHVDTVLNPMLEAHVMGNQYNVHTFDVTYSDTEEGSSKGYYDRLIKHVEVNEFQPIRLFRELEAMSLSDAITSVSTPKLLFIDTIQEFDEFKGRFMQDLAALFPPSNPHNHPMLSLPPEERLFGTHVYLDIGKASTIAVNQFGMKEKGIDGLIYFFSEFVKALEAKGYTNRIDFGNFNTTHSRDRAKRIFGAYVRKNDVQAGLENGTMECVSSFDDLSTFTLSLKHPTRLFVPGGTVAVNKLFSFRFYSKSSFRVGERLVKQKWMQDRIEKRKKDVAGELSKKATDDNKRRKIFAQVMREKNADPFLLSYVALLMSRDSLLLSVLSEPKSNRRGGLALGKINSVWGTLPPVADESVFVFDSQIDEPVKSLGRLSDMRIGGLDEGYWEIDANFFYSRVLMGRYDCMMKKDYYGGSWIPGSPRRAVYRVLDYEKKDFLNCYEADLGYAFVTDINFHPLKLHLGLNELCSWWRMASDNPERVERRVPCASIIHFTSYIVEQSYKNSERNISNRVAWMHGMEREERWIYVQETVLNVKSAYFYYGAEQRKAIKRVSAVTLSKVSDMLEDVVIGPGNTEKMKEVARDIEAAQTTMFGLYNDVGMTRKEARAAVKADFNRAIGLLKNGKLIGSLATKVVQDMISQTDTSENGEDAAYVFEGVPFHKDSMVQVCVRDVPDTDLALSEMVHVTPAVTCGYPRSLRIDILERARLAMDQFVAGTDAFMVKTDAVFFKDHALEKAVKFVEATFPTEFGDAPLTAERVEQSAAACAAAGCTPGKYCVEHEPQRTSQPYKSDFLTVKFIRHPGVKELGHGVVAMESSVNITNEIRYCGQLPEEENIRLLSTHGRDALEKSLEYEQKDPIYTSDLMPTIDTLEEEGLLVPIDAQAMDCDASEYQDRVHEHCSIFGKRHYVYRGPSGYAQPYEVNLEGRNEIYMANIFKTMDSFEDGYLMEGPPGAGKSYALCQYTMRRDLVKENTLVFVATATHLTLEPYKVLRGRRNVHVSTIHSLVGVFNQLPAVGANPLKHFTANKTKYSSRLIRERAKLIKASDKPVSTVIFVDEYEMLSIACEEILLYISQMKDVQLVLLGDRFQTAANGTGFRCDGDVVRHITDGNVLNFDLPFRNPDYDVYMTQKAACQGSPTLFLQEPLSDYVTVGDTSEEAYQELIERVADAYQAAKNERRVFRDPVIALQNYKAIGVTTLDVLKCMSERGYMQPGGDFFVGSSAIGDGTEDLVGAPVEAISETFGQSSAGLKRYIAKVDHHKDKSGPSGKSFLVGTVMKYEVGYSYRTLVKVTPGLSETIEDEEDKKEKKQDDIMMGQTLMLTSMQCKITYRMTGKEQNKREQISKDVFVFEKDDGSTVVLTQSEAQAYLYYPFCIYSGAVVGHTFDDFTLVNFASERASRYNYMSLENSVVESENILQDCAWLSKTVKDLNVAVSRVTYGNRAKIIEVFTGYQGFWIPWLSRSKWHAWEQDREGSVPFAAMRAVVVDATQKFQFPSTFESLNLI